MPYLSASDLLKYVTNRANALFHRGRVSVKRHFGVVKPPQILPYLGYGNPDRVYLSGRLLEDRGLRDPLQTDTWWDNVKAMYRRFTTDEIPDVEIRAEFAGETYTTRTDEEGSFHFTFEPSWTLDPETLWHEARLQVIDEELCAEGEVTAVARMIVPSDRNSFGVISDVDDTIIESHATDFLKLARVTVFNNAYTRTPLEGVAPLYQAFRAGPAGGEQNPIFYVSSSAWNLYDFLYDFLKLNHIPLGPILLRDIKSEQVKLKTSHEHKAHKIRRILDTVDYLPFVLVGDAGQHDPLIYQEIAREYPDRIKAIYIRSVGSEQRDGEATKMASKAAEEGVPMFVVQKAVEMAEHAADAGLISDDAISRVESVEEEMEDAAT